MAGRGCGGRDRSAHRVEAGRPAGLGKRGMLRARTCDFGRRSPNRVPYARMLLRNTDDVALVHLLCRIERSRPPDADLYDALRCRHRMPSPMALAKACDKAFPHARLWHVDERHAILPRGIPWRTARACPHSRPAFLPEHERHPLHAICDPVLGAPKAWARNARHVNGLEGLCAKTDRSTAAGIQRATRRRHAPR